MVAEVMINFLLQIAFTVGLIFLFGWLISLCNKKFYSNFGKFGRAACYVTGIIGTPVHELSHALFCVLFGHRITEIRLFQISSDGTLGYVNHSYNRRNLYQRIGNFFIGVAPVVVISAILYGLACALLPAFVDSVHAFSAAANVGDAEDMLFGIGDIFVSFFSAAGNWQWWVFVGVGLFLCLHMTLSGADIKNAVTGLVALLLLLLAADIILAAVSADALQAFTQWTVAAGSCMLCFFLLALIISLLGVAFSALVAFLIKR